jgi:hypothetical protein
MERTDATQANPIQVAMNGGSTQEIIAAMSAEYVRKWPQAAHDWALELQQKYAALRKVGIAAKGAGLSVRV